VSIRHLFALAVVLVIAVPFLLVAAADDKPWKAGLAVQVITPDSPVWMAGYGARTAPAKGKAQDLYVKVLALEDPTGKRLVFLTSDLIGISRSLGEAVVAEVQKTAKLPRECFVLTA
jgi:neutral ceramidase